MGSCAGCANSEVDKPIYITRQPNSMDLSCKICFLTFNSQQNIPMVMPCGHTVCSSCLKNLSTNKCPFDRTQISRNKAYKNIEIIQILSQKKQIILHEPKTVPKCPKNHTTSWTSQQQTCTLCSKQRGGWKCAKCQFSVCAKCQKTRVTKTCFNGHATIWRGARRRCVECDAIDTGWQCVECNYSFCSKCTETPKEVAVCPNGHVTKWQARKDIGCMSCGLRESGRMCTQCQYNVCRTCRPVKPNPSKCPNNHRMVWRINTPTPGLACDSCNSVKNNGYTCHQCSYMLCMSCSNWRYRRQSEFQAHEKNDQCPNNHSCFVWVPALQMCANNCGFEKINRVQDGFVCESKDCEYTICMSCRPTRLNAGHCFNRHKAIWKANMGTCIKCDKTTSGWYCEKCDFRYCTKCTQTELKGARCPNRHTKQWRAVPSKCLICDQTSAGRYCKQCYLFVCDRCENTDLTGTTCPNGHSIALGKLDTQCLLCNSIGVGWVCQKCEFSVCLKCNKRKLNRVSCPYHHPLSLKTFDQLVMCKRCEKLSHKFYDCAKGCLPICQDCLEKYDLL